MAFPTIPTAGAGRVLSNTQANTTATRTFPNLSSLTKNSGDLLIAICLCYDSNPNAGGNNAVFSSWGGGFTEFADVSTVNRVQFGAAYKWSTGSETGTFSVTQSATVVGHAAMFLLSIGGAHASTIPEAAGALNLADPPSLNPTNWDVEDTLWIAVLGLGEISTSGTFDGISAAPTNYGNFAETGISGDVVGGIEGAVAFRQNAVSAEDPGTFTADTSNIRATSATIGIRPTAAAPVIPLEAASGVASATFALTAQTTVPLAASSLVASGTLALTAPTTVVLQTASGVSSATLGLAIPAIIPLASAGGVSSATLALTAPAKIVLVAASGVSSVTLALRAPAQVVCAPASAVLSATVRSVLASGVTARRFDGVDDVVRLSIGANNLTGAFTIAMLGRSGTEDHIPDNLIVNHNSANSARVLFSQTEDGGAGLTSLVGAPTVAVTGSGITSPDVSETAMRYTIMDNWAITVVTKAAGTTTPRFHIYTNGVWHHADGQTTLADPTTQSGGNIRIPANSTFSFDPYDFAVAAEWNGQALSDAQVEELSANWQSQDWMDNSGGEPSGLWNFNQTSTATAITDETGNGADEIAITGTSVNLDGPAGWDYTITGAAVVVPLAAASGVSSVTLALTAQTKVVLATASGVSSAILALTAPAKVVLETAAAVSSATLALSAAAKLTLASASGVSSATLTLTAPAKLSLSASGVSSATLTLTAPTTVVLGLSSAVCSATLAVFAPGIAFLTLETAAGASSGTLALTAPTRVVLETASGVATATAVIYVPSSTVPLQTASGVASATLSLAAPAKLSLTASGISSATLALSAQTKVVLGASSGVSSATLVVTAPKAPIPLAAASAISSATLTLRAPALLSLTASGISSATLALTAQTRVVLQTASGLSSATLDLIIPLTIPSTGVDLGAAELNAAVTGAEAVEVTLGAEEQNAAVTGADPGSVRGATVVEHSRSGVVTEHSLGAVEIFPLGAVELNHSRGVTPMNEENTGGTASNLLGVVELNEETSAGVAEESVLVGVSDDSERSGDDDETTTGGDDNP